VRGRRAERQRNRGEDHELGEDRIDDHTGGMGRPTCTVGPSTVHHLQRDVG
jgi:hypothetical protein